MFINLVLKFAMILFLGTTWTTRMDQLLVKIFASKLSAFKVAKSQMEIWQQIEDEFAKTYHDVASKVEELGGKVIFNLNFLCLTVLLDNANNLCPVFK